jgi:hypothetical protein
VIEFAIPMIAIGFGLLLWQLFIGLIKGDE